MTIKDTEKQLAERMREQEFNFVNPGYKDQAAIDRELREYMERERQTKITYGFKPTFSAGPIRLKTSGHQPSDFIRPGLFSDLYPISTIP